MNKTTIYKNVKFDEIQSIELNLNSILVIKSDDVTHHMIEALKNGLRKNLSFSVPIIGITTDMDLEDIGAEELIDMVGDIVNVRDDLRLKLLEKISNKEK